MKMSILFKRGFLLLEVVIALFIFVISALAILRLLSISARLTGSINRRLYRLQQVLNKVESPQKNLSSSSFSFGTVERIEKKQQRIPVVISSNNWRVNATDQTFFKKKDFLVVDTISMSSKGSVKDGVSINVRGE